MCHWQPGPCYIRALAYQTLHRPVNRVRGERLFSLPAQALDFFLFILLPQALTPLSLSFVEGDEVVEKSGCPGNDSFLDSKLLTFCSFPERQNSLVVLRVEGFSPNIVFIKGFLVIELNSLEGKKELDEYFYILSKSCQGVELKHSTYRYPVSICCFSHLFLLSSPFLLSFSLKQHHHRSHFLENETSFFFSRYWTFCI